MSRFVSLARGAALLLLAGIVACSDDNGTAPGDSGTGHLTLLLKDAPGDVQAAVVTISEINLQGNGGTTVLSDTAITTDLVTLSSTTLTLLDSVSVAAGSYGQLRFVLSGAYIQVDNGDGTSSIFASSPTYAGLPAGATVDGDLQMPSMGQSGLKVNLPGDVVITDSATTTLLVDFDVAQSFGHPTGNPTKWVMHPVIQGSTPTVTGSATVDLALDPAVTLPILDSVQVTLGDFSASLTGGDSVPHTMAFTDTDGDGVFTVTFSQLAAGDYVLDIAPPVGIAVFTTNPPLPGAVAVTAGATATASYLVTAAN